MPGPFNPRRALMGAAKQLIIKQADAHLRLPAEIEPPRLILHALETHDMSRSRDRILANLDEMYREAFDRAKASGDESQQTTLDFAYRREQLYFEILLDIRDSMAKS